MKGKDKDMGCKYRIMDRCKAEENKDSFCLGKDGCPYYEDENTTKVTDVCKCMYCGAEINWGDSNNPFDEGLHNIPDKYSDNPRVCCGYCNAITSINRNFKRLIEQPEKFNLWIHYMREEIDELENDKDKVIAHYLNTNCASRKNTLRHRRK